VNVEVKDSHGEPVANSEVAIVVCGRKAFSRCRDTRSAIRWTRSYTARGTGVTDYHLRKDILLANPDDIKKPPPPETLNTVSEMRAELGGAGRSVAGMPKPAAALRKMERG
jgi:hypothetical protein